VPAQYLISTSLANPPSEGSVKTQEGPLLSKLRDIAAQNGRAYEEAVKIAAALKGVTLAQVEVIWQPFSTDSDSEMADAAIKWSQLHPDMPIEWVLRRSGMDESTIRDFTNAKARRELSDPSSQVDPAVTAAIGMVTTSPALLSTMTVGEIVAQLRDAGL